MEDNYKNLFKNLTKLKPPHELSISIFAEIQRVKIRNARLRFGFFSGAATLSLVGLLPAFQYFTEALSESGFYRYFLIIFSDGILVLDNSRDFLLLLADSFPAVSVAFVLVPLLSFLLFVRRVPREARQAFLSIQTA